MKKTRSRKSRGTVTLTGTRANETHSFISMLNKEFPSEDAEISSPAPRIKPLSNAVGRRGVICTKKILRGYTDTGM